MITEILSYVPKCWKIEETCKKFNEIRCRLNFYALVFKSKWNDSYTKFLDDDEIFESMMKSQRKISSLIISSESFDSEEMNKHQIERLTQIVEYFSANIKHFELSGIWNLDMLKLLNSMPNVEKLTFSITEEKRIDLPEDFELNLHKLREFVSLNGTEKVLNNFKTLPGGVLRKIDLSDKIISCDPNQSIELFKNQNNLKEISADTKFIKLMDLNPMKLTILQLSGAKISLDGVVNGQDKITKLIVKEGLFENDLRLICSELKSLENFELTTNKSQSTEFTALSKLSNLKKLKILFVFIEDSKFNECVSSIESQSLLDLDISSYRNELCLSSLVSLGLNCSNLTKLKILSRSLLNIINPIISYCPFLTALELHGLMEKPEIPFVFQDGLVHQNLRKLCVMGPNSECQDFPKLIGALQNLEKLSVSVPISGKMLRQILITQPKLQHLDLSPAWNLLTAEHQITQDFVDALKEHGTNLEVFKGEFKQLLPSDSTINLETIKEEFRKLYKIVIVNDGFAMVEWLMRKT